MLAMISGGEWILFGKGNNAAHTVKKITKVQTILCLENLYIFMDFVDYCYATEYTQGSFYHELLKEKIIFYF